MRICHLYVLNMQQLIQEHVKKGKDFKTIRDFPDFLVSCHVNLGFADGLASLAAGQKSGTGKCNAEFDPSTLNRVKATMDDLQRYFDRARNGDRESLGLLLLIATDLTIKLNAAARLHPANAMHFAKRHFVWPGFFSIATHLNDEMLKIATGEFHLGEDLGSTLPRGFGAALAGSVHRQLAYWVVLFMWYVRNANQTAASDLFVSKPVQACRDLAPFSPATSTAWSLNAQDILLYHYQFPELKQLLPLPANEQRNDFLQAFDRAFLLEAPTIFVN